MANADILIASFVAIISVLVSALICIKAHFESKSDQQIYKKFTDDLKKNKQMKKIKQ
jgi:hypothetical protein